mmetsp:Transcript_27394/g.63256  ORF Transcript_27394/g.63256 Transcript_27394/m.63256 type:complete len:240 (-) Transcript_27394:1769-2488(-)
MQPSSQCEHHYCHNGAAREHNHAKRQRASLDDEGSVTPSIEPISARIPVRPSIVSATCHPIDGTKGPRQAQSEEDVHRVAACDVSNRSVGVWILGCSCFGCERVRQRSAECYKGDGCDLIWYFQHTAYKTCKITHNEGQQAYHHQRAHKTEPTTAILRWGHQCKKELPWHGDDVQHPVLCCHRFILFFLLIITTLDQQGISELATPIRSTDVSPIPPDLQAAPDAINGFLARVVGVDED